MMHLREISQNPTFILHHPMPASKIIAATEVRSWGSFTTLEEGLGYKIRRLEVKPGQRLSLQMHHHRSEHWIVISGTAKVTYNNQEHILHNSQSAQIAPSMLHQLENPGMIPLIVIEVQSGEYLDEEDIIQFPDDDRCCLSEKDEKNDYEEKDERSDYEPIS